MKGKLAAAWMGGDAFKQTYFKIQNHETLVLSSSPLLKILSTLDHCCCNLLSTPIHGHHPDYVSTPEHIFSWTANLLHLNYSNVSLFQALDQG